LGGTQQIQQLIVARRLVGKSSDPMRIWPVRRHTNGLPRLLPGEAIGATGDPLAAVKMSAA
jgi:hypothetical protein